MQDVYTLSDIKKLTRRYRKVSWGRLYWKRNNMRMSRFDSDDVCIVVNGTSTTHYMTLDALIRDIEYAEEKLRYDYDRIYDFACPDKQCEGSLTIVRTENAETVRMPDGVDNRWDEIYLCDECEQEFYLHQSTY